MIPLLRHIRLPPMRYLHTPSCSRSAAFTTTAQDAGVDWYFEVSFGRIETGQNGNGLYSTIPLAVMENLRAGCWVAPVRLKIQGAVGKHLSTAITVPLMVSGRSRFGDTYLRFCTAVLCQWKSIE